jgi:hypothetical protein
MKGIEERQFPQRNQGKNDVGPAFLYLIHNSAGRSPVAPLSLADQSVAADKEKK